MSDMDEFRYDSVIEPASKGKKSYNKVDKAQEESPLSPEALEAKNKMLRVLADKLNHPYGQDMRQTQRLLMIVGSRGELYIWDQRASKYEFWNSKDDVWAAIKEFSPDFHAGTKWPERTNEYCLRNYALRCKEINFHMESYDSRVYPDELRAEISCLKKTSYKPVYHEDVNTWLTVFGGAKHDKFLDWLASYTRLDRPTCLLYIGGPRGVGKNLLAGALGKIYGGFADWEDRASDYQSDMGRHPFIWADEEMEKPRRTNIMSSIRRIIGGFTQRINEKQRPAYGMSAYYRVLVTANNPKLLKSWVNLSVDDIDAVRERIGYFYASPQAKTMLFTLAEKQGITVAQLTKEFSEFKIAEHVLWLGKNRQLANDGYQRLLVEGWENEVTDKLEYETNESFLFAHVFNCSRGQQGCSFLREEDGNYWINYNNLVSSWEQYAQGMKRASDVRWKEMKEFISHLYTGEKKRMRPTGSGYSAAQYFYKLDPSKLNTLLVNFGMDAEDVQDLLPVERKTVSLELMLRERQEELKRIEESRIDSMIENMAEGREKDALILVRETGEYKTSVDLIESAIKLSSTMIELPKPENQKSIAEIRLAIVTNDYTVLRGVKNEQVGCVGSDKVYRDQGSADRGGQQGSTSADDSR
jgi:hypothetical protein